MGMTYSRAVEYIEEIPKFTKANSLAHTRECLKRLGSPEKAFRVIHVAGTNGKGSVCAFLDSVLRRAGVHCGLFTSPHLVDIRERFRTDGRMVSKEVFMDAFTQVKELCDALEKDGIAHPNYFETLFLMGMLIFKKAGVRVVVLETGLGGRLDATTAVDDPLVCVITSVSRDHMRILGNTVTEIAAEKAGILVKGVPVVFDADNKEAAGVIRDRAASLGCPCCQVTGKDTRIIQITPDGTDFALKEADGTERILHIPFAAGYQVMNAALAVRTVQILSGFWPVTGEALREGLKSTHWPGRMETALPGVILDGAHNEDGVARFAETAALYAGSRPVSLLFSAVKDKDYRSMAARLVSEVPFSHVTLTQVGGDRMLPARELEKVFHSLGYTETTCIEDPIHAFLSAADRREENGLLFCAGSLYLVGLIKRFLERGPDND